MNAFGKNIIKEIFKIAYLNFQHLFQLDLKSPSSIKRFSADVTQQFPQISVLINNAGICVDSDNLQYSHGSEMHMLINHFGHFMLTKLLLPFIQRGAPSRYF